MKCARKMPNLAPRCTNCARTCNPLAHCWSGPASASVGDNSETGSDPCAGERPPHRTVQQLSSDRGTGAEAGRIDIADRFENRRTISDQSRKCVQVSRSTARHRSDECLPQRRRLRRSRLPQLLRSCPPGSPQATLGATLRQSEIGLEIFGPNIAGARTSADVQLDFAGGFARTGNGVDFGIVRVQNANLRFDWEKTSIVAGQDSLFISPFSPTSFASLATPAFAFAGNLWGWTPQVRVEHRFALSDQQTLTLQAGVLDNLDWEYPPSSVLPFGASWRIVRTARLCVPHSMVASGARTST